MNKADITAALQAVREARHKRNQIDAKFHSDVDYVMHRLILEASANMMSAEEVAEIVGYTPMRIRDLQRIHGLSPSKGRGLMAKQAAEALADNAAIMGIEPHEVDLTSPLAYLPMGSELRKKFLETKVSQVTEIPEDRRERLAAAIYGDGRCPSWYSTVDFTPNSTSYELADRIIEAGL